MAVNEKTKVRQFAYRSNHSTEDAVQLAVDRYLTARDTHNYTGIAFLDMSEAFDKVRHQQLIIGGNGGIFYFSSFQAQAMLPSHWGFSHRFLQRTKVM